ncbi:MAG: hypothetical protein N2484_03155 [Clostridia bacterium]|nr:hypothetical protein [Clostridia bacterium]
MKIVVYCGCDMRIWEGGPWKNRDSRLKSLQWHEFRAGDTAKTIKEYM